jgi:malate dehydrogenase (decarboxylating)
MNFAVLDLQGTAATAVAGLYGAMRVLGKPPEAIAEQRVVCVGAGSAGMGVVRMIAAGREARPHIFT